MQNRLLLVLVVAVLTASASAAAIARPSENAKGGPFDVAVDGRRPGYSVGASFEEGAAIMDALGSGEAVNLDGGGSTGMTVRQTLVTRPSDATGERPIGDAVVLLP